MALLRTGPSDRALAKRGTLYRVTNYDGGLSFHPDPEPKGRLLLSEKKWELRFDGSNRYVHGGLARLPLTATPTGPNSCHVVIADAVDPAIRAGFDLPETSVQELSDALVATTNGKLGIPGSERGQVYRIRDYSGTLEHIPSPAPSGHLVLTPAHAVELWAAGVPEPWSGPLDEHELAVTPIDPGSSRVEMRGLKDATVRCAFELPGTPAEALRSELKSHPHATWTQAAEDARRKQAMQGLVQRLPARIDAVVQAALLPGEVVHIKLKGAFKEALICTDRRVIIAKAGFMAKQTLGNSVYQLPYANIAGSQVKFHLLSGYFELNAGGMQQQTKRYWSAGGDDPAKAPNALSITTKTQAALFRRAATFIMTKINEANSPGPADAGTPGEAPPAPDPHADVFTALEKLAELRDAGVVTADEFASKKAELLGRL